MIDLGPFIQGSSCWIANTFYRNQAANCKLQVECFRLDNRHMTILSLPPKYLPCHAK